MDKAKIPKSRASSLLSMASKVVMKEGRAFFDRQASKNLEKMMGQAEIIVKHVGQLKGAAMKAVQMITVEAQDLLPPEVLKILEQLQSQAPPLSNDVMIAFLKTELGDELFLNIVDISSEPIASASIGQVYEAKINNEPVVIKIQYPGIAESVDSDLNILKKLLQTLLFVSRKEININDMFEEVKRVLKLETDYINEIKSLLTYKEYFKDSIDYRIPKVFKDYCTSKVIVLSKEEGLEFTSWNNNKPNQELKNKVGHLFLNLYMEEFFKNQFVQTDPNPANFLINSQNQLVLIDFGATLEYSKDFVRDYQDLLKSVFQGSDEEILLKIKKMKFLSDRESIEVCHEFVKFIKLSLRPFNEFSQPFDFSDQEYTEVMRKNVLSFTRKLRYSSPPTQIIFLHRKLGGIFHLLKILGVKIDLGTYRKLILTEN